LAIYDEYNEFFSVLWFTDDNGNKVSIQRLNEQQIIVNGKIILNNIPDSFYKVQITNKYEIDINSEIISNIYFKVNYLTGEVYFHSSLEGQTITIAQYFGRGLIKTMAKRVELSNENNLYNATNIEDFATDITNRVNNIVSSAGDSNTEIVDARQSIVKDKSFITLDSRIEEIESEFIEFGDINTNIKNFNIMSQDSRPVKSGVSITSPKLCIKTSDDAFLIIQKANKGYLAYTLNTLNGTDVSSYGVNWELVRLKKVQHIADCYMAYTNKTNIIGTLGVSILGSKTPNGTELSFCNYISSKALNTDILSNKEGNIGIELYNLVDASVASSVDWLIKTGKSKYANIVLYGSPTSSQDVDILVNDIVVKNINTREFYNAVNQHAVIEFEIPTNISNAIRDIKITLRNNSLTDKVYFSCVNFIRLKDYNGEFVDTYKILTNVLKFIDANGASDYAIKEWMGNYCGSYHGGEVREVGRCIWKNPTSLLIRNDDDISLYNFADITNLDWCILNSFRIFQQTDLINKAKMASETNFDIDGTIDYSFGLYDNIINIEVLYTALTCTHTDFQYLQCPKYVYIPTDSGEYEFNITEGKITQYSASRKAEVTIRFNKFNDFKYDRKAFINPVESYNKFYYGIISTIAGGVVLPNLNYGKSIDFYIY